MGPFPEVRGQTKCSYLTGVFELGEDVTVTAFLHPAVPYVSVSVVCGGVLSVVRNLD